MKGTDRKNMLPFTHDFIFGMVMRDPEVCREFLRTVLPKENFRVVKMRMPENPLLSEEWEEGKDFDAEKMAVEIQKSLKFEHGRRGVRFDAYADTPEQSAAIEMQTYIERFIGRRSRLYRSNMDLDQLEAGDSYEKLKRSFVIMITTWDPFELDRPVYFFRSYDVENHLQLNDDAYTMVLNTVCSPGKVPEGLRALYEYINDPAKCEGSALVKAIDARVQKFNAPEWRRRQMTFEEMLNRAERKGAEQLNQLYERLLDLNRIDDMRAAMKDVEFRQKLYVEFGLDEEKTE